MINKIVLDIFYHLIILAVVIHNGVYHYLNALSFLPGHESAIIS